ncbi:unnamed protein product [Camellia sinensis]
MRILLLFSWLFLIPFFAILIGKDRVLVSGQCLNDQSSLLLQLKNNLRYNSTVSVKLVNWTQTTDCCCWKGVTCDKEGHVTGLDLNSESISGGINHLSSLFSLQFLQNLNLAYNNFKFTQIPPSFGNLTRLTHLNLSNANFAGQIPIVLSHMTKLATLDLSTLYFPGAPSLKLENPNLLKLVQNLTGLKTLLLDGVNISAQASQWCEAISSSLPNLRVLSLTNCNLSGPIDSSLQKLQFLSDIRLGQNNLSARVPEFFADLPNLRSLHLCSSNLHGKFPEKIFQVLTLEALDLSYNRLLQGFLPQFPPNGSLHTLVLSNTNFSGTLPDSVGNLKMLSRMELPGCNFNGLIPNTTANLTQLVYLDLSSNGFTGTIPSFQMSKNITYIDLSHNALTGQVPSTHFQGLSNLLNIDLAHNSFNGRIPLSLISLPLLQKIQLSNNQFDGPVIGFSNESLPSLDTLDLSRNKLQGSIPSSFFELRSLNVLSLSFNNFSGTIQLEMIQRLQNLTRLELSYNRLSINASDSKSSLSSFPQLGILKMASCKLRRFPELRNQSRMINLDLSANQISGTIPNWIWKIGSLVQLNLSHNLLVDLEKPYKFPSLSILDLQSNQLHGEIPIPPESVTYVDYSSNNFNSSIPAKIGNKLTYAYFFSLSSNSLTGTIPKSICNARLLNVLDLSNNSFSGTIPPCLIERSTETLGVLNLRNNNLGGKILGTFPKSCALETLDISRNHLEGQVPKSLANCTVLEVLNVGNNEITDSFPCFLGNLASLRVLVLRSNKFHGGIRICRLGHYMWLKLQIIDLASNNFSGDLPDKVFTHWTAMTVADHNAKSNFSHLKFEFLKLNGFYYQDTVTLNNKGMEMELVKILTIFTSIDISNNNFQGVIPNRVGDLKSLYVLNASHNALTGPIPSSIGNLAQLGSLDLSQNRLSGSIPMQLASLTFLSFLNLSYNQLVGMIPTGSQIQTFADTSFKGNKGLCGYPLNISCNNASPVPSPAPSSNKSGSFVVKKFNWQFIFTGLGFGIGAGVIIGPLMFWKQGSKWCNKHIERFAQLILPSLGFIFAWCDYVQVEPKGNIEEENQDDKEESDEDEDENAREGKAFSGLYCVFCSKLDIHVKKGIHNPKCNCHHDSPSISSLSLSPPS